MRRVFIWPRQLPPSLNGLSETMEQRLGDAELETVGSLEDLSAASADGQTTDLLIVLGAALMDGAISIDSAIGGIQGLVNSGGWNLVIVVGDGFLGTDLDDLFAATGEAAAISAARSIAVRREATVRANVVCVPAAMFEYEASQRGPIPQAVECSDVAEAASFFLDDANTYLNGQVLFVNGGRQLFSSFSA